MAKKKLAVLAIHGMGAQYKNLNADPRVATYSEGMRDCVREAIGASKFKSEVGWYEVYWADVLQQRQKEYGDRLKKLGLMGMLRQFVMYNLSDAASYYPKKNEADSTYNRVHARITQALKVAADDVEPEAPLIIVAHSLGGHIMSNYIYDVCKARGAATGKPGKGSVRNFETFRALFTFGCNIPVFMFATKEPVPISYPGLGDAPKGAWWYNFFDADDPLGFPLGPIGGGYAKLVADGQLKDCNINAGDLIRSMTPWSHNLYWTDSDVVGPIAERIKVLLDP